MGARPAEAVGSDGCSGEHECPVAEVEAPGGVARDEDDLRAEEQRHDPRQCGLEGIRGMSLATGPDMGLQLDSEARRYTIPAVSGSTLPGVRSRSWMLLLRPASPF
jgi:hypothetical protein